MSEIPENPRDPTLPSATIRPTVANDTWSLALKIKGMPAEAICHVCEPGDQAGYHGPDTNEGCKRWVERHLWDSHKIVVTMTYDVEPGREHWPQGEGEYERSDR